MGTHICRDATDAPHSSAETIFVCVGNQATEDGVDVEGGFIWREIMQAEPETRHSICRVQMDLV